MSKRLILWLTGVDLVIAAINGWVFLWIEFQNNNQGEYFDTVTGVVDLPYAAEVFLIVFLLTATLLFPVLLIASLFARGVWQILRGAKRVKSRRV